MSFQAQRVSLISRSTLEFGTVDKNGISMFFLEGSEPSSETSTLKKVTHAGSYKSYFDQ